MTTTSCPNCGQPLRPGARFCGSCGSSLPGTPPQQAAASPSPQVGGSNCPHCGKLMRPGAKFCNHCGKPVDQESLQPPTPPPDEPARVPPVEMAARAPEAPTPEASAERKGRPPRKRYWLWILFALFIIICGVVTSGAYIYFKDPFGLIRTATPTLAETEEVVPTQITDAPATSPATLPVDTPSPTVAITPTEVVTPTMALTITPSATVILLEDDFDSDIGSNWTTWGKDRPRIDSGPLDSWLDLVAAENPDSGGVTSRKEIPNSPGIEIEFEARLNEKFPQYVLLFDWDPVRFSRGSDNTDPGIVHIEIWRGKVILQTPTTRSGCEDRNVSGEMVHTYLMKIVDGQGVELYVDGAEMPICQVADMGLAPVPGRISFTGVGWVTSVKVIGLVNE